MPAGNYIQITSNTSGINWSGILPDLFNAMSMYLNFTYSIALSRDGKYGKFHPETGRWSGMIGDVVDDVADIAVGSISVIASRSKVVDFMIPFGAEKYGFFVNMDASYAWATFLLPFLYESWAALVVMLVCSSLIFAFVAKVGNDKCLKEFTLEKCVIYVFGAYGGIAVRRWSITPSNISARIIFIFVLSCGSLIHWHWKASIISHLSVSLPSIPFRSGAELVESPYQVCIEKDTSVHSLLESAASGIFKEIWDTKFENKDKSLSDKNIDERLSLINNEKFALLEDINVVQALLGYKDCSISDTGYILLYYDIAFPFQKNSAFKDLFNHALIKMKESGELHRIQKRYKPKPPDCGGGKGRSLGFDTIGFAFVIFCIGPVLAVLILVGENITKQSLCFKSCVGPLFRIGGSLSFILVCWGVYYIAE